jgi:F-type H+-transporting ATPase subunit a
MTEAVRETMSLGERIAEALSFKTAFTVTVGNVSIPVSETVVTTWVVMAILIVASILFTRRLTAVPKGMQVFLEAFVGSLNSFFKDQIGHHWKVFAPYLGTIALFLGVADMIAFVSPIGGFGFEPPFLLKPPTRDINVTAALALMTIVIVLVSGIVFKGFKGWLKSFIKPAPFMLPFNILEYFIKPLSLCLRLFGNILGAFIIMELIGIVIPLFLPPVFGMYFDFFDGLVQAVVFVFLSTLYIAEAVE